MENIKAKKKEKKIDNLICPKTNLLYLFYYYFPTYYSTVPNCGTVSNKRYRVKNHPVRPY